jgi:hypothetical protein
VMRSGGGSSPRGGALEPRTCGMVGEASLVRDLRRPGDRGAPHHPASRRSGDLLGQNAMAEPMPILSQLGNHD